MDDALRRSLAATPLFADLSDDQVDRLVAIGRVEYFAADSTVISQGDSAPRLLLLLEGEVEVLRRDTTGVERSVGSAGPGEMLGEVSLLLDLPRTATVTARTDLRCFALNRVAYQQMLDDQDPAALKLGVALARLLATRLLHLNDRVAELIAQDGQATTLHQEFSERREELFRLWG